MPEMMVWPDSSSVCTRKVGSSLVKRPSAFEKFGAFLSAGTSASEMTGSGTNIDVIDSFVLPSVKVVPEAQSTPNMATMSPAPTDSTSSISLACMRTSRGMRTLRRTRDYPRLPEIIRDFLRLPEMAGGRTLRRSAAIDWIVSPRPTLPW